MVTDFRRLIRALSVLERVVKVEVQSAEQSPSPSPALCVQAGLLHRYVFVCCLLTDRATAYYAGQRNALR